MTQNLLYTNSNPNPDNICDLCRPNIGKVFAPGNEIPVPIHPGCWCTYYPTSDEPTEIIDWPQRWANMKRDDPKLYRDWVQNAAYRLRQGEILSPSLEPLREDAVWYNEHEYEPREDEKEEEELSSRRKPMPDIVSEKSTRAQTTAGRILLQPTVAGRREYECVFMQPGLVKQADGKDSNWFIPADVIAEAAPLFNSVASYLDHPEIIGFGWRGEPSVRNLAGVTFDTAWSDEKNALVGNLRLYDEDPNSPGALAAALFDQILADKAAGREVPNTGLSAVIFHETDLDEARGYTVTTKFTHVESVDIVYSAGAGGYVRAALAAIQPQRQWQGAAPIGGNKMPGNNSTPITNSDPLTLQPAGPPTTNETLATIQAVATQVEALTAQIASLGVQNTQAPEPPVQTQDVASQLSPDTKRLDTLTAQVETLTQALAAREEKDVVVGMGDPTTLSHGLSSLDQVNIALEAMLSGVRPAQGVRPLTGIREMYHLLSGDFEMTGVYQEDRVYLANVNCSTMAGLVANRMNKRVVNLFQEYPKWWEKAVTIEDFATLQDVRWITLGGIGELPTVNEGAAYTELTWDDQTETDAFKKKGGYLGLTLEAIDKDDTRKLIAAPRALAQGAWLTLGKAISAIFTDASGTGPTMSDSVVLFHAVTHGNLLTTALSASAWKAVKVAMQKQGELSSTERLGALTYPKLLWVPIDKEDLGLQILATQQNPESGDWGINVNAEGNERETRLSNARKRLVVCPLWTNTDNWAAQADPLLYPSIGLGFRYGRTPEVVSVASPTAGLMFSNDVMPIKARFFFAVGPIDWRGLHKSNI